MAESDDFAPDRVVLMYDEDGNEVGRLEAWEAVPGKTVTFTPPRRVAWVRVLAAGDVYA